MRISGVTADNQRHVSVMTLRGGKGNYFILIAPDEATRDRFLPVFEQIVSSFSFTPN